MNLATWKVLLNHFLVSLDGSEETLIFINLNIVVIEV
jgi:hypothetical protein